MRPSSATAGSLNARPGERAPTAAPAAGGEYRLNLGGRRDAVLYVPGQYDPADPLPLVIVFHGAGASGGQGIELMRVAADRHGLLVLAPDSRSDSWDLIRGGFGPDVQFLDQALGQLFDSYSVDRTRVAVAGFSDGASYAVSLALVNGDLFTHVLAWSPGFAAMTTAVGKPRIFISHGTRDRVLPIERCSRRLVPALRANGYAVTYREFDGPHTVPDTIVDDSVAWFLNEPIVVS